MNILLKKAASSRTIAVFAFILLTFSLDSCKKNKVPKVKSVSYQTISPSSLELSGEIIDDGGAPIVDLGFCWGKMEDPTIENGEVEYLTSSTGSFSKILEDLEYNSFYYFRAFASNKYGLVYGDAIMMYTKGLPYTNPACTPQTNWAYFNNINLSYTSHVSTSNPGYKWTMTGNANYSDLSIHFNQEPTTGNYVVVNNASYELGYSECEVNGVFGVGLAYFYRADAGDTVYVQNDGNGHFSMSFCGLTFRSPSTSYTFTTNGNLTN